MYDGGYGGDYSTEIMFRQGCIKARFSNDYTLTYPETVSDLGTVTLQSTTATNGYTSAIRSDRFANKWKLFNPCTIGGVKCEVISTSVTPIEECSDVQGGWIKSYGAEISKHASVNVYYIGRNGGFGSINQLVLQNQAMVDYGSSQYIVLGFHEPITRFPGNQSYITKMEAAFGDNFLYLNQEIRSRAAEITYLCGVYDTIDGYNQESGAKDREYVSNGDIPLSLYRDDKLHPNYAGCQAFAILIHDKMVKLGYLNDNYILSDGEDL